MMDFHEEICFFNEEGISYSNDDFQNMLPSTGYNMFLEMWRKKLVLEDQSPSFETQLLGSFTLY